MQAVAFTQTGGPEVLRVLEVPDPTPGPGQAELSAAELRPKSLRWAWFGVFNAYGQPDVWAREVANLVPLIASGAVDPYITGVYTCEQAPEAQRLLEGRLSQGKMALLHPN